MAKTNCNLRDEISVTHGVHVGPSKEEKNVEPVEHDSRKVLDPLEGFDVESGSEKEFLEYCLENNTPKLEIGVFENSRRSPTPDHTCSLRRWRTDMTQEEWDETVAAAKSSRPDWQEFKFLENATTEEIDGRIYELIMDEKNKNRQSPMTRLNNMSTSSKIKRELSNLEQLNSRDSTPDSEGLAFAAEAEPLGDGKVVKVDTEERNFDFRSRRLFLPNTPLKSNSSTNLNSTTPQKSKSENHSFENLSDKSSPSPIGRRLKPKESQKTSSLKSPFFSPPPSAQKPKEKPGKEPRPKAGTVSCIPFPPLTSSTFGLLQEKLARDPFQLLIGVTFLNRTHGKYAIPVFFKLMEKYPTPVHFLSARRKDIIDIIRHLGLQIKRTDTYIEYARLWTYDAPVKGRRYRVDHYPSHGDGMDIKKDEVLNDTDTRQAWEIGHITQGRYAIDSWRIFCRDVLRKEAEGWNGEGREGEFQPEWMRVRPEDKELRAILRWMWLKEGFQWDPSTGEKESASQELQKASLYGKIVWDDEGGMRILHGTHEKDGLIMTEGPSASALKALERLETSPSQIVC